QAINHRLLIAVETAPSGVARQPLLQRRLPFDQRPIDRIFGQHGEIRFRSAHREVIAKNVAFTTLPGGHPADDKNYGVRQPPEQKPRFSHSRYIPAPRLGFDGRESIPRLQPDGRSFEKILPPLYGRARRFPDAPPPATTTRLP